MGRFNCQDFSLWRHERSNAVRAASVIFCCSFAVLSCQSWLSWSAVSMVACGFKARMPCSLQVLFEGLPSKGCPRSFCQPLLQVTPFQFGSVPYPPAHITHFGTVPAIAAWDFGSFRFIKSIVIALTQFACLSFLTRKSSPDHHCIYAQPTAGILPSPRAVQSPGVSRLGTLRSLGHVLSTRKTPGLANKSQVGWDAHPSALASLCVCPHPLFCMYRSALWFDLGRACERADAAQKRVIRN